MVWVIALLEGWIAVRGVLAPWTSGDVEASSPSFMTRSMEVLVALNASLLLVAVVLLLRRRRLGFQLWVVSVIVGVSVLVYRALTHPPYRAALLSVNGVVVICAGLGITLAIFFYLRQLAREDVLR